MMTRIIPRDWEMLSAYLDHQLGAKEEAQLEVRLGADAELRAALQDLRRTRTILRSQPRLRASRNFTLTPDMAGVRRRNRSLPMAYPMLRLASALATVFFVVLFIGNLALQTLAPRSTTIALAQPTAAMFAAPAIGMGGGGAAAEAPPPPEQPAPAAPAAAAKMPLEPAEEASAPTEDVVMESAGPATAADMPESKSLPATPSAADAQSLPTESQAQENAMKVAEGAATPTPSTAEVGAAAEATRSRRISVTAILAWLQVILALVAVGAGLLAFYLRRSARD